MWKNSEFALYATNRTRVVIGGAVMAVRFDPTKEVPSLELCERLEKLGYPQDGESYYWRKEAGEKILGLLIDKSDLGWILLEYVDGFWVLSPYLCWKELKKLIKAPTVRELGEWIKIAWENIPVGIKTRCHYPYSPSEIDPNLLAEDLIWLVENGYVKFRG